MVIRSGIPRNTCLVAYTVVMLRRMSNVFGLEDGLGDLGEKHKLHVRVKDGAGGHEEALDEDEGESDSHFSLF